MTMKSDCKISIIVPIFNAEKHLNYCLKSIQVQTYRNFEAILINDGSTDNSLEMCHYYADSDERFVIINKVNEGVSEARNNGLNKATGEYVVFIDADDWVDNTFLESILKYAEDSDIVQFDYYLHDKKDIRKYYFDVKKPSKYYAENIDFSRSIRFLQLSIFAPNIFKMKESDNTIGVPWGKAYKRTLIENNKIRFNKNLRLNEDVLFNILFLNCASKVSYCNKAFYHYRVSEESFCGKNRLYNDNLFNLERYIINIFDSELKKVDVELSMYYNNRKAISVFKICQNYLYLNHNKNYWLTQEQKNFCYLISKKVIAQKEVYKYLSRVNKLIIWICYNRLFWLLHLLFYLKRTIKFGL